MYEGYSEVWGGIIRQPPPPQSYYSVIKVFFKPIFIFFIDISLVFSPPHWVHWSDAEATGLGFVLFLSTLMWILDSFFLLNKFFFTPPPRPQGDRCGLRRISTRWHVHGPQWYPGGCLHVWQGGKGGLIEGLLSLSRVYWGLVRPIVMGTPFQTL